MVLHGETANREVISSGARLVLWIRNDARLMNLSFLGEDEVEDDEHGEDGDGESDGLLIPAEMGFDGLGG